MKKKRIAQYCCAVLVLAGMGLNIQNALTGYGLGENTLSLVATGGSGSSGSNSNSNSSSNSGGNDDENNWYCDYRTCGTKQVTRTLDVSVKLATPGDWVLKCEVNGTYHYEKDETTDKFRGFCIQKQGGTLSYGECQSTCNLNCV